MPRLQILVHKSYHPYLESNKQRVREDEAKAAAEEEAEERRMLDADSEARLDILRRRALDPSTASTSSALMPSAPSSLLSTHRSSVNRAERKDDRKKLEFDWPTKEKERESKGKFKARDRDRHDGRDGEKKEIELGDKGHINFWDGIEKESALIPTSTVKPKPKPTPDEIQDDDPTTMYLNRPERETKPWYTDPGLKKYEERQEGEDAQAKKERRRRREERQKSYYDPMTEVQAALAAALPPPKSKYTKSHPPPTHQTQEMSDPLLAARLKREEGERARAAALVASAKRRAAELEGATPRSSMTGDEEFSDLWNEKDVKEARRRREEARYGRSERDEWRYGGDDGRRESARRWDDDRSSRGSREWIPQSYRRNDRGAWEV